MSLFSSYSELEEKQHQFVYIVKPLKKNFSITASEEDNDIVSEHFSYLKGLLERKILILAGPELNAEFGLVVFEAKSEEEARAIMENDPAVRKGVFSAKLYPYKVSLIRKD